MKLKILMSLALLSILSSLAFALPADYFVKEIIDISSHLTNPQALEVIPGGFIVIDWETPDTTYAYLLDGQGNLMNETNSMAAKFNISKNSSHLSTRITGIRVYNFTSATEFSYAVLDDTGKNITLVNSSDFTRVNPDFHLPTGEFASDDDLAGFCTNKSDFWVAIGGRDVISNFGGGGNNSINQSEFTIPGNNNAGGLDCFQGNNSQLIVLDDTTGIVHLITKSETVDFINLSDLTSRGLNTFSDVAFLTDPLFHRPDFYALNNDSKLIYHIMKRTPNVLNIYRPTVEWSYPGRNQLINTRFSSLEVKFNFTAFQPNNSVSNFTDADEINCTILVNGTINTTTLIRSNNASINYSVNITFGMGYHKVTLDCISNITYAKKFSEFKILRTNTFKHVVWMGDNFSVYYDSDALAFKAVMGNGSVLTAGFNITPDEPVALRLIWNNDTNNMSIYVDGVLKDSKLLYQWTTGRPDKIYLLGRNDTGQANAVVSYFQTSLLSTASKFVKGTFIESWTTSIKNLIDKFTPNYFYQFKATLKRGLSSENPILRFVNISFDDTLMNFSIEPDVDFLDFGFSSGTSSSIPAGQTDNGPIFTIWNIGNVSFDLLALSLTPFDSCFNVPFFNQSGGAENLRAGSTNNTINLSTTAQRVAYLTPGKKAEVWLNVSASGCTSRSEFFDIEFITSP